MNHEISLIAAMDCNRLIGAEGSLPWHLPADLRWFRRKTIGKPVVMGRRTWEAIGRPLPERNNIVLTGESGYQAPGATVVHDLQSALSAAGEDREIMIIGGGVLFADTLHIAERLYLTVVEGDFTGDTWFPLFDTAEWHETWREAHPADERNPWPYTFLIFERTSG